MDEASAIRKTGKWRKQVMVDRPDHPLNITPVLRSVHKRKTQTNTLQTHGLRIVLHQIIGLGFGTPIGADGLRGSGFVETFCRLFAKDLHAAKEDDPSRPSGQSPFQYMSSACHIVCAVA